MLEYLIIEHLLLLLGLHLTEDVLTLQLVPRLSVPHALLLAPVDGLG